ncbi:MAG: alpha/beta hydrolase, partial [Candidatus Limnocylindria bacterium]
GARIVRDIKYHADERGALLLDAYRPDRPGGPWPGVLLVNGDAPEPVIARAKDWGVFRSYGEHLAARGIVGLPFNHRSTEGGACTGAVAREVAAAIAYVRGHATELEVDADRIGVWAFSAAGPFGIAPLLRDRPTYLRALAGFYAIWDLAPFRDTDVPPSEASIQEWSATAALGDSATGLPPIFVARAGRDGPRIMSGTDRFLARALALDLDVQLHNHPTGQHGFDIRDDDARSREIVGAALDFFVERFAGSRR